MKIKPAAKILGVLIVAGALYEENDPVDVWIHSGTPRAHWDTGYRVVKAARTKFGEPFLYVTKNVDNRNITEVFSPQFRHTPATVDA